MTCTGCSATLADGARFCSHCGAKQEQACGTCHARLTPGQKFCSHCGASAVSTGPLEPPKPPTPAAPPLSPTADRRVVTVLFTDVSGFTSMSEKLDPEEVTEIVNNFFKVLTEPIYRYGGVVDKYIGDAIMALFGAPVTHEDDPERAVRAAWEMQIAAKKHAAELESRTGILLKVRIGLNTGLVVAGTIGGSQRTDYTVMGDTVNLAQSMEANAKVGKVLVTAETYALTRHAFGFEALDPISVKGKVEPIQVYELKSLLTRTFKLSESNEVVLGRRSELARLEGCWETALAGRAQVAVLVGEVGLGKSALSRQFIRSLRSHGAKIVNGRGLSYEQQTGYAVVAEMLHYWLGLLDLASTQETVQALERLVTEILPQDADRTVALLSHLLSLPVLHPEIKSLSPKQQRTAAFLAFNDMLLAIAETKPLLVSLEDMHWADEASLEWISSLADRLGNDHRPVRLMVLCQSRPDSVFTSLGLAERVDLTKITLRPLAKEDALAVAAALLGATMEGLPGPVQALLDQVLGRAEGNPFYLAELIKSLIDGGVLVRTGATWAADRPAGEFRLPTTVQGAIAARLDRLKPASRRMIQVASVIGRSFDSGLLGAVSELDPAEPIAELTKLGFLYSRSTGEVAFSQAMIQEVAYQNLLLANRRDLHRKVGLAIETGAGADVQTVARTLAFHFVRSETADKACRYLLLAGHQGKLAFALGEALTSYRQSLEWFEKSQDTNPGVDRSEILAGLASVEIMAGDLTAALDHLEAALGSVSDGPLAQECHRQVIKGLIRKGDSRAALVRVESRLAVETDSAERAVLLTSYAEILQGMGQVEDARARGYEALALLEGTDRRQEMAGVYNVLGNGAYLRRSPDAIEHYQKNLALREAIKDVPGMAAGLNNLALAQAAQGQWPVAADAYNRALKIYAKIGDVSMVSNIQINLGDLLLSMGKAQEAGTAFQAASDLYTRLGNPLGQASAANCLGKLAIATGQAGLAIENLERSFQLLESSGAKAYAAEVLRCLGQAHMLAGDAPKARDVLELALTTASGAHNEEEAAVIQTLQAELRVLDGDPIGAAFQVEEAIVKLRELGNPLELGRALVRSARINQSNGEAGAASTATSEAMMVFELLGAELDLAAARALSSV